MKAASALTITFLVEQMKTYGTFRAASLDHIVCILYAIYILEQRKEVNDLLEFVVIRVTTSSHANNGIHGSNSSYWGLFINCKERGQNSIDSKISIAYCRSANILKIFI